MLRGDAAVGMSEAWRCAHPSVDTVKGPWRGGRVSLRGLMQLMGTFVPELAGAEAAGLKHHRRHRLQLLRCVGTWGWLLMDRGRVLVIMAKVVKTITDHRGASGFHDCLR